MDIDQVLSRGVAEILPGKKELVTLMKKRKIKLYQGFDATAPSLHIGHFIGLRKLAQFQKLGHKVIFLIGDFTSLIGDPTDKKAARVKQTRQQVMDNFKNYKKQAGKIIDFDGKNKAEVVFNSSWLGKLNFEEILNLSSNFTVGQMLERNMFQERLKNDKPVYLHEFMYPLMQGYDSVYMNVDLEIGGSDQLFNMMAGRTLMKAMISKEKYVLTTKLLEDPGGKKMGKTEGNSVDLSDSSEKIFGKIMSLPDGFIDLGIELLTDLPLDHRKRVGPLAAKKDGAFETVAQVHGNTQALKARDHFETTFQKASPSYFKKISVLDNLLDAVVRASGVSNSQAKRLIAGSAVSVNNIVITNPKAKVQKGDRLKIGKKLFVTLEL